ncbi:WxL protein peptidoglycan domain-containing protein [Herbiconiux sp. P18]|uniref:WxL protein peptidoglycan domain-containing protein n=1 Tax=Herbiconiux liangxiaofengii TaxID=3342795 RepID=UPI0035B87546
MTATPARSARALSSFAASVAVTALVALGLLIAPAGIAHAADGDADWAVRTATNDQGSDRTSYSYALDPGTSVEDTLVVVNHGAEALDLGVYAADGYTTDSGQFDVVVGGAESTAVGAWLHSANPTVHLEPGATADLPFTLTVPENATPGDYAGAIVTSLAQTDDAQGINVDRRLGIKVSLRIGGDLTPGLAVENMHVDYDGGWLPFVAGDATVGYTLHNTGNAVITAEQAAGVSGPFGWFQADAEAIPAAPQLLPGESWTVSVPVSGVPPLFLLTATATVAPVVLDASGSTTSLDPVSAEATGWAVPWTLVITGLVVLALVAAAIVLRRRGRAARAAREDARVKQAVEKALATAGAGSGATSGE